MKTKLFTILALALAACHQQAPTRSESTPPAFVLTDEFRGRLASADTADGKTDHVVEKCATCRLRMPGNPKFTVTIGDYQVQLCSAECMSIFEKDPVKFCSRSGTEMLRLSSLAGFAGTDTIT